MDNLVMILKNRVKNIISRYLWKAVKPVLLTFLPHLIIMGLVILILLSIFGAAPKQTAEGKEKVKKYVESIKPEVISKYRQEENFRLPWGIVYAVEEYANDWSKDVDMTRVKRIAEGLKPEFEYMDYTEKIVTVRFEVDAEGNVTAKEEVAYVAVKLLTQVRTYEGIYVFEYQEMTDVKGNESRTYMALKGMEFYEDYSKLDAVITREIKTSSYSGYKGKTKTIELSGGKLLWPVPSSYTVTSPFGMRFHPVTGTYKMHTGIDIAANTGDEIVAAADGVVITAAPYGGYGNIVVIDHSGGISTLYAHNSQVLVKVGDVVKKGQKIALAGSTGTATGPHLHFEVRVNGTPVNPLRDINVPAGSVEVNDSIDRKFILETGIAFMKGDQNLEWLLGIGASKEYAAKPGRIPENLLPVFKEAGREYGIPWYVLAAIAFRESSFNPNAIGPYLPELKTRAVGMMQFLQSTFDEYAVDGNNNGTKSPFEPEDAVFTAARYLAANRDVYLRKGFNEDEALRYAVWHYNHAWWYVDQVMAIGEKYKNNYP
ncbi:MAG TPA: peptidoglycan DD-metalloendopeptidase family protein [Thermoanaerobacter sp.]|nr:peptidoglycan DD-metalloendopeptidase family protein [Thermoanaerobacter sp.]